MQNSDELEICETLFKQLLEKNEKRKFLNNRLQSSQEMKLYVDHKRKTYAISKKKGQAIKDGFGSLDTKFSEYVYCDYSNFWSHYKFCFSLNVDDNFVIDDLNDNGWSNIYEAVLKKFFRMAQSENSRGRVYLYLSKSEIENKITQDLTFREFMHSVTNVGRDLVRSTGDSTRHEKHTERKTSCQFGMVVADRLKPFAREMTESIMISTRGFDDVFENKLRGDHVYHLDFDTEETCCLGGALFYIAYMAFMEQTNKTGHLPWFDQSFT